MTFNIMDMLQISDVPECSGEWFMTDRLHTDLGTPEVHKRHAVMVEGGTMPRAKVMDQNLIDRYLMDGLLTLGEHQAGEYVLSQAMKAGILPSR